MERSNATTFEDYIAEFPPEVAAKLHELYDIIRSAMPDDAVETFSYAIPTFDLNGRHLVHFAGFKKHVSFFPTGQGGEAFKDELAGYKGGKGTVQFPLDEPLPADLIRRITAFRVDTVRGGGK